MQRTSKTGGGEFSVLRLLKATIGVQKLAKFTDVIYGWPLTYISIYRMNALELSIYEVYYIIISPNSSCY